MKNHFLLISSNLSILFGGLIYILFRSTNLKMFAWFNQIGFKEQIRFFRHILNIDTNQIPEWVIFSLPDGLWLFSYLSFILLTWKNQINFHNIFWLLIIPILALSSEIGQFFNLMPGTFDIKDLIFYILGTTLPFLIHSNSIQLNFK